jgi:hypothetical protein
MYNISVIPSKWKIFDYVDMRNVKVIVKWLDELQKAERARMDRKLQALQDNGPNLSSELLSDTPSRHIKKIRLNGRVAPRLLLCRGPVDMEREFTLLFGAMERDRKFVPENAIEVAEENRGRVTSDPDHRRIDHDFTPTTPK